MSIDLNKPAPKGWKEDSIDGIVLFCPTCNMMAYFLHIWLITK